MAILSFDVLLLLLIKFNVGVYFAIGQSTFDDRNNDEQDKCCNSDVLSAQVNNMQSEFQNLRAQISSLEDRVERQKLISYRCPPGFYSNHGGDGKCYSVLTQKLTWEDGRQQCRILNRNAHLAVITNESESQHISSILKTQNCTVTYSGPPGWDRWRYTFDAYWVGGQLQIVSNCNSTFVWKPIYGSSQSMRYKSWHAGEPNCAFKSEACVAITKSPNSTAWNDMVCTWPLCSVCEVRADSNC